MAFNFRNNDKRILFARAIKLTIFLICIFSSTFLVVMEHLRVNIRSSKLKFFKYWIQLLSKCFRKTKFLINK